MILCYLIFLALCALLVAVSLKRAHEIKAEEEDVVD